MFPSGVETRGAAGPRPSSPCWRRIVAGPVLLTPAAHHTFPLFINIRSRLPQGPRQILQDNCTPSHEPSHTNPLPSQARVRLPPPPADLFLPGARIRPGTDGEDVRDQCADGLRRRLKVLKKFVDPKTANKARGGPPAQKSDSSRPHACPSLRPSHPLILPSSHPPSSPRRPQVEILGSTRRSCSSASTRRRCRRSSAASAPPSTRRATRARGSARRAPRPSPPPPPPPLPPPALLLAPPRRPLRRLRVKPVQLICPPRASAQCTVHRTRRSRGLFAGKSGWLPQCG